jgi:FkbM family methyltransferase
MTGLTTWQVVRERAHPLYHARRLPPVRALLDRIDVPVWMRLRGIPWPVRARLVSHLGYWMLPLGLEPSVAGLLVAAGALFTPRSFWDVGANFGYYTWLLKACRPELQALMVEPDPANQRLITATLARTPLTGVVLCRYAASDAAGTAPFARDPVSGATGTLERPALAGTFARRHWRARDTFIEVPTRPLDDERSALGPVGLLKIDVEGHEERVLHGARQIIAHDRPVIVVECFHTGLPAARMLGQHRYVVLDAERLTTPGDRTVHVLALPAEHARLLPELRRRCRHATAGGPGRVAGVEGPSRSMMRYSDDGISNEGRASPRLGGTGLAQAASGLPGLPRLAALGGRAGLLRLRLPVPGGGRHSGAPGRGCTRRRA